MQDPNEVQPERQVIPDTPPASSGVSAPDRAEEKRVDVPQNEEPVLDSPPVDGTPTQESQQDVGDDPEVSEGDTSEGGAHDQE